MLIVLRPALMLTGGTRLMRAGGILRRPARIRLMRLLRLTTVHAGTLPAATPTFTGRSLRAGLIRVTRTLLLRARLLSLNRPFARFLAQRRRSGLEVRHGGVRHRFANRLLDVLEQAILIR